MIIFEFLIIFDHFGYFGLFDHLGNSFISGHFDHFGSFWSFLVILIIFVNCGQFGHFGHFDHFWSFSSFWVIFIILVFLDHFGIPSLDFSYSNSKAHYGQYHSIYDSFAWMDKFGGGDSPDSEGSSFELMAFAAKLWGLLALRLADSPIVPLDHVSQGRALTRYSELPTCQSCQGVAAIQSTY